MAFQPITGSTSSPGSRVFPILVFVQGNDQRMVNLDHTPARIGHYQVLINFASYGEPAQRSDHRQFNGGLFLSDPARDQRPIRYVADFSKEEFFASL
jgi:hypothetical protein